MVDDPGSLVRQIYDHVLFLDAFFARYNIPIDQVGNQDYHKFTATTLVAFSEETNCRLSGCLAQGKTQLPIASAARVLEKIVGYQSDDCIPKDLVRQYLFQNEKYFDLILRRISESELLLMQEQECTSAAKTMFSLLKDCSIFTMLGDRCFIQRTGESVDAVISSTRFVPRPAVPAASAAPDNRTCALLRTRGKRRRKRKTKDISSEVIYLKSMMYNSWHGEERSFRQMFDAVTAPDLLAKVSHHQHQPVLSTGLLPVLMEQLVQRHQKFFTSKFRIQQVCPVYVIDRKDLSELVTRYTCHSDVCNFLRIVSFKVFPAQLFGTKKQLRKFYRSLTRLVTSAYTVRYQYKNFVHGIRVNLVHWLSDLETSDRKKQAFGCFTKWAVNYFMHLLQAFFYATETQFGKFELFFFRKDVWHRIVECSRIDGLAPTTQAMTCDRTRLIPKHSSVRLICPDTAANKLPDGGRERSALVSILQAMRSNSRPLLFDDLSDFCSTVRQIPTEKLFMMKADIRDCYPCIRHDLMGHIIKEKMDCLTGEKDCRQIRCRQIRSLIANSASFKVQTHFLPILSQPEFTSAAGINGGHDFGLSVLRNRILVPAAEITIRDPVQKIVSQFKGNVMKHGSKLYLLTQGIRQGGSLSPELCRLYMESFLCSLFVDLSGLHVAVRADDVLIASGDREKAVKALQLVLDGSHLFNFRANNDKLSANFETGLNVLVKSELPFCGASFHCDRRAVTADFSQFKSCHLKHTFNCNPFASGRTMAMYVASQFSQMRPHLVNTNINDKEVVAWNLYERSVLQGMRFACFLLCSPAYRDSQDVNLINYFVNLVIYKCYHVYHSWHKKQESVSNGLSGQESHFIAASAILRLWETEKNLRKRKQEKRRLALIREKHRLLVSPAMSDMCAAFSKEKILPFIRIK